MADNINIKDAAAITRILRAKEISPGIWAPYHVLLDSTGAEILGEKAKASSAHDLPGDPPGDGADH